MAAEVERGRRLHRLEPSQPLKDAADAAAFVRERRIVTETGHAGVPVLAHTIAERIDLLVDAGRIERLVPAPRERWLLSAGPTGGSRPAGARRRRP